MKAAAFFGVKDIRVVEIKKPEIKEDGVLLKMRACGICGSDMHVYNTDLLTEDSTKLIEGYRVIGHEYTGEVVEVGKKAKGFKIGDRVASVHNKAGMAEYIEVPGDRLKNLHRIPEGTSFETAATLEPFCNPTHSFHMREPKDKETVAIFGAGIIGLGYLQLVKAYTKARTIICDVSELRLGVAAKIGADVVINAREKDPVAEIKKLTGDNYVRYQKKTAGGCDVAIDCAGFALTLLQAFEVLKPENGTLIIASIFEEEISIDPNMIVFKYMSVLGSMGYYDHETVEALNLIGTKKVNRDILVTHKIPLEKAAEGFRIQGNSRESVKVVLVN
jgi:threonine dehydrogenase-like Zn-dependent dehydrogenase